MFDDDRRRRLDGLRTTISRFRRRTTIPPTLQKLVWRSEPPRAIKRITREAAEHRPCAISAATETENMLKRTRHITREREAYAPDSFSVLALCHLPYMPATLYVFEIFRRCTPSRVFRLQAPTTMSTMFSSLSGTAHITTTAYMYAHAYHDERAGARRRPSRRRFSFQHQIRCTFQIARRSSEQNSRQSISSSECTHLYRMYVIQQKREQEQNIQQKINKIDKDI